MKGFCQLRMTRGLITANRPVLWLNACIYRSLFFQLNGTDIDRRRGPLRVAHQRTRRKIDQQYVYCLVAFDNFYLFKNCDDDDV